MNKYHIYLDIFIYTFANFGYFTTVSLIKGSFHY